MGGCAERPVTSKNIVAARRGRVAPFPRLYLKAAAWLTARMPWRGSTTGFGHRLTRAEMRSSARSSTTPRRAAARSPSVVVT
eukprot:scaffold17646_cov39-Phaeocystis_antarctica.AAC.1